ncbi:MAG: response regulator [Nitrospina sp.]|jgi:CheY-like chemotaxis protein|nr:response regulator [Nitrospina sp.]
MEQGRPKSLLIVDDELALVEFVAELFEDESYTIAMQTDGAAALQLIASDVSAFDLVITDQTMPSMLGTELAQSVRELNATVPIILCTGFTDDIAEEAFANGFVDVLLQKPVRAVEFIEEVARHLG